MTTALISPISMILSTLPGLTSLKKSALFSSLRQFCPPTSDIFPSTPLFIFGASYSSLSSPFRGRKFSMHTWKSSQKKIPFLLFPNRRVFPPKIESFPSKAHFTSGGKSRTTIFPSSDSLIANSIQTFPGHDLFPLSPSGHSDYLPFLIIIFSHLIDFGSLRLVSSHLQLIIGW